MNRAELSGPEKERLAQRGYADPIWFFHFFLEEWFPSPIPPVHRGLVAILLRRTDFLLNFDEDYTPEDLRWIIQEFVDASGTPIFHLEEGRLHLRTKSFTAIKMPRGGSKTTILNAVTLYEIVYKDLNVALYLSESATHSTQQMTNVTTELTSNELLLGIFGKLKPEQRGGLRWSESDGIIQTTNGVSLLAKGIDSQLRGINVNSKRPDRINVDDLEDYDSVASETQRNRNRQRFFGDLLPGLSRFKADATVTMLGTEVGDGSILDLVGSDAEWTVITFGVLDSQGRALWPRWMTVEQVEVVKERYASKGLLHLFYLEYMNKKVSPEEQKFRGPFIIESPIGRTPVDSCLFVDPAISNSKRADFAAFVYVEKFERGLYLVRAAEGFRGMGVRKLVDTYFEWHERWNPLRAGFEGIGYQIALEELFREEMFRRKRYFEIYTVKSHDKQKDPRILGVLQPRYANSFIRHAAVFPQLETQLLDFPRGKKDLPDCLAMAIKTMEPTAGAAGDGSPSDDEYEPLEELLGGDWRSAV